jgi:hypothetical protein
MVLILHVLLCIHIYKVAFILNSYLNNQQVTSCKLWRQVGESFKPPKYDFNSLQLLHLGFLFWSFSDVILQSPVM